MDVQRVGVNARHVAVGVLLLLFFSNVDHAHSESKRIRFSGDEGLCTYEIRFRTEQNSEAAVRGTIDLLTDSVPGDVDAPQIWKPDDIAKIDLPKIDAQCANKISKIAWIPTLPLVGIEDYRRLLMEKINDTCRFEKIGLAGHKNASALREHTATAACSVYVDALEGKADLHSVFNEIARNQCSKHADTKQCLGQYQKNSADIRQVKIDVLGFGWRSCVVPFIKINAPNNSSTIQPKLFTQFRARYGVKRIGCEN